MTVPADAATGTICVNSPSGQSCSAENFTVPEKPRIDGLSANRGVSKMPLEIYGSNFSNVTVLFGNIQVAVNSNDGSTIRVNCPDFSFTQQTMITVKNNIGESSVGFTGAPPASITKAIPNGLIPGSALTLKGNDFNQVQSVMLPGGKVVERGSFIRNESNDLTIKVPVGTQSGDVLLINEYGNGSPINLSLITGGSGLGADNIATGVAQVIATGNLNNGCGQERYIQYYVHGTQVGFFERFIAIQNTKECFDNYKDIPVIRETIGGATFKVLLSEEGNRNDYKDPEYKYELKINFYNDESTIIDVPQTSNSNYFITVRSNEIGLVILNETSKATGNTRTYIGNPVEKQGSDYQSVLALYAQDNGELLLMCQPKYSDPCNSSSCQNCAQ